MSPYPTVSVVIPARNAESTIGDTLESVLAQDYAGALEIIIADGSEGDTMRDFVHREFPQVTVIANHRKAIPSGLNRAIEAADGEVIARCDAHTILPPDYISASLESLRGLAAEGVVSVGGRAVPVGANLFGRSVARAVMSPLVSGDSRYKVGGHSGPVDTVYLGVFCRDSWAEAGGYDEFLEANEDYEFNWRLRRTGGIVWFDSKIHSRYRPRENPVALARQGFNYGRWKSTMLLENPRSLRMRQLWPPATLLAMAASLAWALGTGHLEILALWPGLYLLMSLAVFVASPRRRDPALLLLPVVIPIMHLSWAAGFFLPRRRRGPGSGQTPPKNPGSL